jgi:hypothetical protein
VITGATSSKKTLWRVVCTVGVHGQLRHPNQFRTVRNIGAFNQIFIGSRIPWENRVGYLGNYPDRTRPHRRPSQSWHLNQVQMTLEGLTPYPPPSSRKQRLPLLGISMMNRPKEKDDHRELPSQTIHCIRQRAVVKELQSKSAAQLR